MSEILTSADGTLTTTPGTGAGAVDKSLPNAGVNAASAAARAMLASAGTILPATPEPGTTPETPTREVPAVPGQPRASDGTFGKPLPPAPTDGQAPPSDEVPAVEGEQAPTEEDAAAARTVPIELPDGNGLDLDVGDPAVAEVLRSHIETARAAETIRAESERTIEEVTAIRDAISIDPVGFVLRELHESAAGQEHLALSILTQPEMFTRLRPQLEAMLEDERNVEVQRARQQVARQHFAEEARTQVTEQRAVQANLRDVQNVCASIARMLPNEAVQGTAYNDMLRDVMAYAEKANALTVPPEHLPVLLANRLIALGINPVEAATTAAAALSRKGNVAPPRATVKATPRPASAPMPPAPKPNGQQFVASQQRRSAIAIPSGGAGSPNVGSDLVPPTKADGSRMGIAESVAWHREQIAKGRTGKVPLSR